MSGREAEKLQAQTRRSDEQDPIHFKGYKFHEFRDVLGGQCDRHWGAHTPSKTKGPDCELWAFRGERGLMTGTMLRQAGIGPSDEASCTRFDMAFDFHCEVDLRPVALRDSWARVWRDELRLKGQIKGEDGSCDHTAYIGGGSAMRQIRIYRKDIERGRGAPTLRVELVLKGEWAEAAHGALMRCDQDAVKLCASHVLTVTGFLPVPDFDNIPLRTPAAKVPIAASIAYMLRTGAKALRVAADLGLDLLPLLELVERQQSKSTRGRVKRAGKEAAEAGLDAVRADIQDLLLNG